MAVTPDLDTLWSFLVRSRIRQMRGQPEGSVAAARDALAGVAVDALATTRSRRRFDGFLASNTEAIRKALPSGSWGWARKVLNLVLRDAIYNAFLRDAWRLDRVEQWSELPLDGVVAAALRKRDRCLPSSFSLRTLTPVEHERYQEVARRWAADAGTLPVHLDIEVWSGPKADSS